MVKYFKLLSVALLLAAVSFSQNLDLKSNATTVAGGDVVQITADLTGGVASSTAALQLTFKGSTDTASVTAALGSGASASQKMLTCNPYNLGVITCIVNQMNATLIDGQMVVFNVTFAPTLSVKQQDFRITQSVGASSSADPVLVAVNPTALSFNKASCDVTGDGNITDADLFLMNQWALGLATPPAGVGDLDNSGTIDVVDVQIVVYAKQSGVCKAK